jgi:hypothetical protein
VDQKIRKMTGTGRLSTLNLLLKEAQPLRVIAGRALSSAPKEK